MPLRVDGNVWSRRAWGVLKNATLIGIVAGFLLGGLSLLSGNTISVNGTAIGGWNGVWTVTIALGLAGFGLGLIGFLVFSALAVAGRGSK